MNEQILQSLVPTANKWYDTDVQYEGEVTAYFEKPTGRIKGRGVALYNEQFMLQIEMRTFDEAEIDGRPVSSHHELRELFTGYKPVDDGSLLMFPTGVEPLSRCFKVEVVTESGKLTSTHSRVGHHYEPFSDKAYFWPSTARFEANFFKAVNQAKYWAIPLTNYVPCEFDVLLYPNECPPAMNTHPLRVFPPSVISNDLTGQDRQEAIWAAYQHQRYLYFEFQNQLSFVEPIAEYYDIQSALIDGRLAVATTAMAVGELPNSGVDFFDNDKWWPVELHFLLSFTIGTQVGSRWIELRNEAGELLARIHRTINVKHFDRQYYPFNAQTRYRPGNFITKFLKLEGRKDRVTAGELLLRAGQTNDLDERVAAIMQALDAQSKAFEIGKSAKARDVLLADEITKISEAASLFNRVINRVQQDAVPQGVDALDRAELLKKLLVHFSEQSSKEIGFGRFIRKLLEISSLHDADIFDAEFATNGEMTWHGIVQHVRGRLLHTGRLQFPEKTKVNEVEFIFHLHDIAIRLFFLWSNYEGQYHSPIPGHIHDPVNYVTSETTARQLGYHRY